MKSLSQIVAANSIAFAEYLLENLERGMGYTLQNNEFEIKRYEDGYQVSIMDMYKIPFVELTARDLWLEYLGPMYASNTGKYDIGLWLDEGFVYIDYSINIVEFEKAMSFAKKNKQMSIYGWAEDDFFRVGE